MTNGPARLMCMAVGLLIPPQLAAGQAQLEAVMDHCRLYAEGQQTIFANLGPLQPDASDPGVFYQSVDVDAGILTIKLIPDADTCWLMGARFDPDARRTTLPWADVSERVDAWIHGPERGPYIDAQTLADLEFGTSSMACLGGGIARQLTATGGGTDEGPRGVSISMKTYPSTWCQ